MTKIRITERELRDIIIESVTSILNESFSRAGRILGINYNAQQNYKLYKTQNSRVIMDNTEQLKLSCLTNEINKAIPCFSPIFTESVSNEMYTVRFQFVSVVYWRDGHIVLKGPMSISGRNYKDGYIEYDSSDNSYHRVSITSSRGIKRINLIEPDEADSENLDNLVKFQNGIKEAEEQYSSDINAIKATGPTPQRNHLPYGAYSNKTRSRLGLDKVK